jgi:hypothetical protein
MDPSNPPVIHPKVVGRVSEKGIFTPSASRGVGSIGAEPNLELGEQANPYAPRRALWVIDKKDDTRQ